MKVKYVGKIPFKFHIPGIKGWWIKDEEREIDEQEYEIIKDNQDFIIIKEKIRKGGDNNATIEY